MPARDWALLVIVGLLIAGAWIVVMAMFTGGH